MKIKKEQGVKIMANKKESVSENKKHKQIYVVGLTVALLAVIILFIFAFPSFTKGPLAGKATDYGDPVTETAPGQFGIDISSISAGAPWVHPDEGTKYDEVEVTGFVNFEQGAGTFYVMRLKLNFNSDVLEPISITPLHPKYQSDLGTEINDDNVLIYYVWSGSASEFGDWIITGKKNLFKVTFNVIAPNPGDGESTPYSGIGGAAWLEDVSAEVLNDDSGFSLGVYKKAVSNINVQIVDPVPNPESLSLTVYPGCYDQDGDGYALASKDKQSCDGDLNPSAKANADCDDTTTSIKPGAPESCNGVDDNCNGEEDEGLEGTLGLNAIPNGQTELNGVCWGYKVCSPEGAEINSYDLEGSNYGSEGTECDNYDNDCNGLVNDGLDCEFGEGGQSYSAGNIYLDFITGTTDLAPEQEVKISDFNSLFLIKALYQDPTLVGKTSPYCKIAGSGNICVCKNGDYYKHLKAGDPLEIVGYYFVDYSEGTKTSNLGHYVEIVGQYRELHNSEGEIVQCEVAS
jgi:hypothetical protein